MFFHPICSFVYFGLATACSSAKFEALSANYDSVSRELGKCELNNLFYLTQRLWQAGRCCHFNIVNLTMILQSIKNLFTVLLETIFPLMSESSLHLEDSNIN